MINGSKTRRKYQNRRIQPQIPRAQFQNHFQTISRVKKLGHTKFCGVVMINNHVFKFCSKSSQQNCLKKHAFVELGGGGSVFRIFSIWNRFWTRKRWENQTQGFKYDFSKSHLAVPPLQVIWYSFLGKFLTSQPL